jgi:GT2 family glycosyltransferase
MTPTDTASRLAQALTDRDSALERLRQVEEQLAWERELRGLIEAERRTAVERADALENATLWKMTGPLRLVAQRMPRGLRQLLRGAASLALRVLNRRAPSQLPAATEAETDPYPAWSARFDTPGPGAVARIEAAERRTVLIAIRFDAASIDGAPRMFEALERLIGVEWSAQVGFDHGCSPAQIAQARQAAARAPGIAFFPDRPAEAPGAPVLFIQGGALPRPHAAWTFLEGLARLEFAYADEDFLDDTGRPSNPWFKPAMGRLLLEQGALVGRMALLRADAALVARLLDPQADAAAVLRDHALALADRDIVHIPHVLFHNVLPLPDPAPRAYPAMDHEPLVSIVIPTRDRWDLLGPCLESIFASPWPRDRLEVIVVDNGSSDQETLEGLAHAEQAGDVRVVRDPTPFNFSRLINLGARAAKGEVLLILNNDTEVLDPDWIRKLASYAVQPWAGAVGAKLLYPDGLVQHAGVVCGLQGAAGHGHVNLAAAEGGYFNLAALTREILAVTGACLAVRRSTFDAVGGLDEDFRVAFNDVVFCLDVHAQGLRNVCLADPLLTHHESKTRGRDDSTEKVALWRREAQRAWIRHPALLRDDPSYSPNLSLDDAYQLAAAPRRRALWSPHANRPQKIMMLSGAYARDHGEAIVVDQQIRALLAAGRQVIVAGPTSANDFAYPGCDRLDVADSRSAAAFAVEHEIDLVVAHAMPFLTIARWLGAYAPVLAYDHGEAPPHLLPDEAMRRHRLAERDHGLAMAARVVAICEAVAQESRTPVHAVAPPGDGRLGRWDAAAERRRADARQARGWSDRFVVLDIAPLDAARRRCKGVDAYAETIARLRAEDPQLHARAVFVLSGKADAEGVGALEAAGLTVFADVPDNALTDLYAVADAYLDLSLWAGHTLGIGQALAMGLPVVASDIPAHAELDVCLVSGPEDAARALAAVARQPAPRIPRVREPGLALLIDEIDRLGSGGGTA